MRNLKIELILITVYTNKINCVVVYTNYHYLNYRSPFVYYAINLLFKKSSTA